MTLERVRYPPPFLLAYYGSQLQASILLERHTRIFRVVNRFGWVDRIGKSLIRTADGNDIPLEVVRDRAEKGLLFLRRPA